MVVQYIILCLILLLALSFVVFRIYMTFRYANDKCYGCSGCAIHDQMQRKKKACHVRTSVMEQHKNYDSASKKRKLELKY